MSNNREVVLFAVVGMSPAVITETIWALAHEKRPVIPDRVVVLTTSSGRAQIVKQLLSAAKGTLSGWDSLKNALAKEGIDVTDRLKFGNTGDSIRAFTSSDGAHELSDIATSADNAVAADFMLRHLRGFTDNPETTVIASIAGGRKTMSALIISCMSLLAREQDRVCHVLVNPPYDTPLTPPFLFPCKRVKHVDRDGKAYSSVDAVIELADVPFVRMLGWYREKFDHQPPNYSALVASVQKQVPKVYPVITLDMQTGRLFADEEEIFLSVMEFPVLYLFVRGTSDIGEIADRIVSLQNDVKSDFSIRWFDDFQERERLSCKKCDDMQDSEKVRTDQKKVISKIINSLRNKLLKVLSEYVVEELVPRRGRPVAYPESKIRIKGELPFKAL